MRFFITLNIPSTTEQQIHALQQQLKIILPRVRLTSSEKLHLTIAFMGNQPAQLKERLIRVLEQATQDIESFSLTPSYIDAFPHIQNPRIIWLGVKGDIDKLLLLQERIKDSLDQLEILTDHRPYIPHIAIAKAINLEVSHKEEQQLQTLVKIPFDPIIINSIKLYESIPSEGFHIQNTLFEAKLLK